MIHRYSASLAGSWILILTQCRITSHSMVANTHMHSFAHISTMLYVVCICCSSNRYIMRLLWDLFYFFLHCHFTQRQYTKPVWSGFVLVLKSFCKRSVPENTLGAVCAVEKCSQPLLMSCQWPHVIQDESIFDLHITHDVQSTLRSKFWVLLFWFNLPPALSNQFSFCIMMLPFLQTGLNELFLWHQHSHNDILWTYHFWSNCSMLGNWQQPKTYSRSFKCGIVTKTHNREWMQAFLWWK